MDSKKIDKKDMTIPSGKGIGIGLCILSFIIVAIMLNIYTFEKGLSKGWDAGSENVSWKAQAYMDHSLGNAIDLFNQFCEDRGMYFQYVTYGQYIRCSNDSQIQFYNISFEFKDEIWRNND